MEAARESEQWMCGLPDFPNIQQESGGLLQITSHHSQDRRNVGKHSQISTF